MSSTGDGDDPLLTAFVEERPVLVGLAYRITGPRVQAEDIVQEAWLRARRADVSAIDRPGAWLTTVVSRLALDHLRSARHRRETYVGPWLPEPVVGPDAWIAGGDPSDAAELAESVTYGFLQVLETLTPVERVVFLLADVFDVPFPEIAGIVDRSPVACRQVASRARRRMREGRPRDELTGDARAVAYQLFEAMAAGNVDQLLSLLAEDAVLVSDGGPDTHAARRPVVGRQRVARFLVNTTSRLAVPGARTEGAVVNGEPGVVISLQGQPAVTVAVHVAEGAVGAVYVMVNPDKLTALDLRTPM